MKSYKAKSSPAGQGDLFGIDLVASLYKQNPELTIDNASLYKMVSKRSGLSESELSLKVPIGISGQKHSLAHRKIRWSQQSLRRMGIIERVKGERGIWRLTEDAKRELNSAKPGVKVLAFSTDLGLAVFGSCMDLVNSLDQQVMLCLTSPPYPLSKGRRYGNPDQKEIVNFIMSALEPVIEKLDERGSLVVNVSNDIFLPGSPARSTYVERLIIALEDAGLSLMDRLVWRNESKAPGPVHWASKTRQQLNVSYEPIMWFCKNPLLVKSDNRRVLEPHSDRHLKLIAAGGEARTSCNSDGSYRLREGSFGASTAGKIPKNVISRGHRCGYGLQYQKAAQALGLPVHGAGQPFSIAEFLIKFLTDEKDIVFDPFGGRLMTSMAAEILNRQWISTEINLQYIRGAAELFRDRPGFYLNPQIKRAFAI